jgi:hypothetical protein
MRPLVLAGLAAGLTALAAACSPAPAVDCSGIQNVSTIEVPQNNIAEQRPADGGAGGGTIDDGTYVRTETRWYTGTGGTSGVSGDNHRQTIVISDGAKVLHSIDSKNGGAEEQLVFSVRQVNANLDATLTCGKTGSIRYGYLAAPPNLLYLEDSTSSGGVTKIHTFQRQ